MQIFGLRGFESLFDQTVRTARYMARRVMQSTNFQLLVKPMTNILLYRWIPLSMREKAMGWNLTDEDNDYIDACNRKLQDVQKLKGKCFVSRTTITCPMYDHKPVVGLRVVIGNPLTTEADIDTVLEDQNEIINAGTLTDDFSHDKPEAIIERKQFSINTPDMVSDSADHTFQYWTAFWDERMSKAEKVVYQNNLETFLDALVTPDCLITDPGLPQEEAMRAGVAKVLQERAQQVGL